MNTNQIFNQMYLDFLTRYHQEKTIEESTKLAKDYQFLFSSYRLGNVSSDPTILEYQLKNLEKEISYHYSLNIMSEKQKLKLLKEGQVFVSFKVNSKKMGNMIKKL